MFDPSKFTVPSAKPLPVCLLLDISGSMQGSKIDNLNRAVKAMLSTFAEEEKMETEILVSIITFGGDVKLHLPFTKASNVSWQPMMAFGSTPLGTALEMAKQMIEDKQTTPSRAYRPTIILVSDGQPTGSYQKALDDFIGQGRSSKCFCMAMAIGGDADEKMLNHFIANTPFHAKNAPNKVLHAENAEQISEMFQRFTMSVTTRTRSQNPNDIPQTSVITLEGKTAQAKTQGTAAGANTDSADDGYW
jgi:uncharacterized protein YegL